MSCKTRSDYKPIGDFIRQVNIRNNDEKIDLLLGVNLDKIFIKSVANTVGTDMSKYKIIKKGQFGCKLMSVGRDRRLPISRLLKYEKALISSAYFVFEVSNESILNPEYLMMWFLRSESDRYLWFQSGGDIRGRITWDEFCTLPIKIPPIEKQNQIVAEYNAVDNRIRINEQLNQKLEETAQAIYKHWFVDFNFPITEESCPELVSGSPKLLGQPYKSSGGKLVYNEELDKEIPEGWEVHRLDFMANVCAGGDKPKVFSKNKTLKNQVPIYSNSSVNEGLYGYTNQPKIKEKSVTISARGAIIGFTVLRTKPFFPIIRLIVVIPNYCYHLGYLYNKIMDLKFDNQTSSAQGQLTIPDISSYKIIKPKISFVKKYQIQFDIIYEKIEDYKVEIDKLEKLKDLLLSKMSKVEVEKEIV